MNGLGCESFWLVNLTQIHQHDIVIFPRLDSANWNRLTRCFFWTFHLHIRKFYAHSCSLIL